ncbi:methionine--tRNA ligase [Candidatus Woesearchaeota archaeon]|nr:methionine--tRNA ligase [Candidatus Woesearchaeota archaeon]
MKRTFYITTAIDYPNSYPHIGHAYEKVVADALARWKRLLGFDVFFLTGTDEHGQKLATAAEEKKLTPQEFVDEMARHFIQFADKLDISYDDFIRTSQHRHKVVATEIFSRVHKKGDIYKGFYEGHYCMPCETFYTEKDLVVGHCPKCKREVKWLKEDAYFFAMSKYKQRILEHIEKNITFIWPESRRNEILSRLQGEELRDLCVSRSGITWGIPLPIDKSHVIYVWFDALVNYISAIDYPGEKFVRYWPAHHVIGKDILWFHAVIWPAILLAAGIPVPRQIYVHGFINDEAGEKMSKSKGNVVDPIQLMDKYSADVLRYYLLRSTSAGQDGNFSEKDLVARNNTELANDLGNLLLRVCTLITKNWGSVPKAKPVQLFDAAELVASMDEAMNRYEFNVALEKLWEAIHLVNKHLNETEPWKKSKDEQAVILYTAADALRIISILAEPFIPQAAAALRKTLGVSKVTVKDCVWGKTKAKTTLGPQEILFHKREFAAARVFPLALVVGKITDVSPHPNADKLYLLKVDIGRSIQLVAGLKPYYSAAQLLGRIIIVVSNLKPAMLRGVESQGMLLAADDGKHVIPLTCGAPPGSKVELDTFVVGDAQITYDEFAKIKLTVKDGHVLFDQQELHVHRKPVTVSGVDEAKATIR